MKTKLKASDGLSNLLLHSNCQPNFSILLLMVPEVVPEGVPEGVPEEVPEGQRGSRKGVSEGVPEGALEGVPVKLPWSTTF